MAISSVVKLPPPPADLSSRTLPIKRLRGPLFRIHRTTHRCLYFGRNGDGRFDDPLKKFGVLYAAFNPDAAFAEVFLRRLSSMLISESDLLDRSLSEIICKPIACVDLAGAGLRQLSCDNRISTEKPYRTVGLWSRAIFDHPQRPDGVIYRSRHNPKLHCVALFDRCHRRLKVSGTEGLMTGRRRAWAIEHVGKYKLAIEPLP